MRVAPGRPILPALARPQRPHRVHTHRKDQTGSPELKHWPVPLKSSAPTCGSLGGLTSAIKRRESARKHTTTKAKLLNVSERPPGVFLRRKTAVHKKPGAPQ